MQSSVLPTLLIGLGDFGRQVLVQVATSVREAYGPAGLDGLSLIGMDFDEPSEPAPYVYQSLYADITDWIAQEHVRALPSITEWFDAAHYIPNLSPRLHSAAAKEAFRRDLATCDRQVARLVFFRYLTSSSHDLLALLDDEFLRLKGLRSEAEEEINIFVLGALSEGAMAGLVCDMVHIANLAARAASVTPRVTLYAALPSSLETATSERCQAEAYATLRELVRLSGRANPWKVHSLIRYHTVEKRLHESRYDLLIDSMQIFSDPIAADPSAMRTEMSALWADLLLPLLDSVSGVTIRQHLAANRSAREMSARTMAIREARAGSAEQDLFLVGTQTVAAARFPRQYVTERWTQWLARDAAVAWLQAEVHENDLIAMLTDWAARTQADSDGQANPLVGIDLLLEWHRAASSQGAAGAVRALANKSVGDGKSLLDAFGLWPAQTHTSLTGQLSGATPWTWEPEHHTASRVEIQDLRQLLRESLETLFGNLALLELQGTFSGALDERLERKRRDFAVALRAFCVDGLKRHKIKLILAALRLLADAVGRAQVLLEDAQRRSLNDLTVKVGGIPQRLENIGHRETKTGLLKWFGAHQESTSRAELLDLAKDITYRLRTIASLRALAAFCARIHDDVRQVEQLVADQYTLLAEAPDALLRQVNARAATHDTLTETQHRFWLYDEEWCEQRYEEMLGSRAVETVLGALEWELEGPRESVRLRASLGAWPFDTAPGPEAAVQRFRVWHEHVQKVVEREVARVDAWTFLLTAGDAGRIWRQVEQRLQSSQFALTFSLEHALHSVPLRGQYLFMPPPPANGRDHRSALLKTLRLNPGEEIRTTARTQLSRLSLTDLLPLETIRAYREMAVVYEHQQRCHVLPEEVNASRWEGLVACHFGLPGFRFLNTVVMSLLDAARVELFLLAEAAGIIGVDANRYLLVLPGWARPWILSSVYDGRPARAEALARFCLQGETGIETRDEGGSEATIPFNDMRLYLDTLPEADDDPAERGGISEIVSALRLLERSSYHARAQALARQVRAMDRAVMRWENELNSPTGAPVEEQQILRLFIVLGCGIRRRNIELVNEMILQI